ncbi:hypothetical protein HPG69_002798, partial [Diceros bicornis minor]
RSGCARPLRLYCFETIVGDLPVVALWATWRRAASCHTATRQDSGLLWTSTWKSVETELYVPVSECRTSSSTAWMSCGHTYSVHWSETSVDHWSDRCHGDDGGGVFPQTLDIYRLPITSSMVLMFLLVGVVAVILNDLAWYNSGEEMTSGDSGDDFDQGDNGWNVIVWNGWNRCSLLPSIPWSALCCA